MAKPTKKPVKKAAPSKKPVSKAKPKAAAPKNNVKTAKPTKAPKAASKTAAPKVSAPKASPPKISPKGEAAKKSSKVAEKTAAPVKADKKAKKEEFDDYEDNFDDEVAQYEDIKTKTPEQMEELRALLGESDAEDEVEIALRDAEGRLYCKMRECDELSIVDGYCRFHYLKLWKRIQLRKKILTDGKLEKYIEELTLRYPDKYIEMIREDLKSEKHFLAAIQELEIEDGNEEPTESDDDQGLLDEVRGIQTVGDTDDDSF